MQYCSQKMYKIMMMSYKKCCKRTEPNVVQNYELTGNKKYLCKNVSTWVVQVKNILLDSLTNVNTYRCDYRIDLVALNIAHYILLSHCALKKKTLLNTAIYLPFQGYFRLVSASVHTP